MMKSNSEGPSRKKENEIRLRKWRLIGLKEIRRHRPESTRVESSDITSSRQAEGCVEELHPGRS